MQGKRYLTLSGLLITPLVLGLIAHGCTENGGGALPTAFVFQVSDAATAAYLPKGPDAIGGMGSGMGNDVGDFIIANQNLRAVIDQPGIDPTSLGGGFPLANVGSPSGGTLVDLAIRGVNNDNFNQMGQAVVGTRIVASGLCDTNSPAAGAITATLFATGGDFGAAGVAAGDVLAFSGGLNDGLRVQVAAVLSTTELALFVPPPLVLQTDTGAGFAVVKTTSPLDNLIVYDSAAIVESAPRAILRLTGGVLNFTGAGIIDGTTVDPATGRVLEIGANMPITVETDYILTGDDRALTIETRVTNPGGAPVSIFSVADVLVTGGSSEENLLAWTPLAGFTKTGLATPIIVPYVGLQGRGSPGASYACVDPIIGQMIHASGDSVAANIQVSTASDTPAGGTTTWNRKIAVGGTNAVSSAADVAIQLLGNSLARANTTNPAAITTIPNMYEGTAVISGRVLDAPPGTRITAQQVNPALTFDPGAPSGATGLPGFYPSVGLGAAELIINQTRPGLGGGFQMLVPARFAGLSPSATAPSDLNVPPNLVNGTSDLTYRVVVEAPGMLPQSVVVNLLSGRLNNLTFDFSGQLGTLDLHVTDDTGALVPCQVTILGVDPDGAGPLAATPNPTLGTPPPSNTSGTADETAAGTGNVVYLVDGQGQVRLPAGNYQVIASRGIEYTSDRFPAPGSAQSYFTLAAGTTVVTETAGTPMQLTRVLDSDALPTVGVDNPLRRVVSADFHVHADGSFDSTVPNRERVLSFLGQNVEVLVSTEHDNVNDLRSAAVHVDRETLLDVDTLLMTQAGTETTGFVPVDVAAASLEFPNTIGHHNAWPIPLDPTLRRNGAPPDEYRTPANLYDQLRALGTTSPVIQMNHPRYPVAPPPLPPLGLGFFTNGKTGFPDPAILDPQSGGYEWPLTSGPGNALEDLVADRSPFGAASRYIDFDTLEVYGGPVETYDITRMDWYALLSAGLIKTATANSDTHTVTGSPGIPRNFVFASLGAVTDASTDVGSISPTTFNADVLPSLAQSAAPTVNGVNSPRAGASTEAMEILCSSGPVVYIEIDANEDGTFEAQPGDLVEDDGDGSVDIRVTILAAPWVPVDQALIIQNGGGFFAATGNGGTFTNISGSLSPNPTDPFSTALADVVRLRGTFSVAINGAATDDWFIVEARGTATLGTAQGDAYNAIVGNNNLDPVASPNPTAVGFTNPIFVSDAADGDWDPNGVP